MVFIPRKGVETVLDKRCFFCGKFFFARNKEVKERYHIIDNKKICHTCYKQLTKQFEKSKEEDKHE